MIAYDMGLYCEPDTRHEMVESTDRERVGENGYFGVGKNRRQYSVLFI